MELLPGIPALAQTDPVKYVESHRPETLKRISDKIFVLFENSRKEGVPISPQQYEIAQTLMNLIYEKMGFLPWEKSMGQIHNQLIKDLREIMAEKEEESPNKEQPSPKPIEELSGKALRNKKDKRIKKVMKRSRKQAEKKVKMQNDLLLLIEDKSFLHEFSNMSGDNRAKLFEFIHSVSDYLGMDRPPLSILTP